jgi:hypothetical protein
MMNNEMIQPMDVVRDKDGWWSHPGIPDFGEDMARYKAWLAAQGLETTFKMLEYEPDTHPVWQAYFDEGSTDVSAWTPPPPQGEGWFTFSIHDTEDGPVWVWARRNTSVQPTAEKGGAA